MDANLSFMVTIAASAPVFRLEEEDAQEISRKQEIKVIG